MSALTEANQTQLIRNKNCYQLSSKQLTTVPAQAIPRVKTGDKKDNQPQHGPTHGSFTPVSKSTPAAERIRSPERGGSPVRSAPSSRAQPRPREGWEPACEKRKLPLSCSLFFVNPSYLPTCFLLIKLSKKTQESCVTYSLIKAFQVHPLLGLGKFLSVILALDFELIADRRSTKAAIARDFNDGHLRINKTVSDTQFKLPRCSKICTKTCFSDFTSFAGSDALNRTEITTSCLVCSPEADVGA